MSDFSSNLRRIRKQEHLSQDLLAEKLGVTRQTISSWERGNSYPDLDMLVQISQALRTSPNALLYPPGAPRVSRWVPRTIWGKLAVAVFIVGFCLGLSAGGQGYAPAPNIASWHFVFSDALRQWIPALLLGMLFWGIETIVVLLDERRERE